ARTSRNSSKKKTRGCYFLVKNKLVCDSYKNNFQKNEKILSFSLTNDLMEGKLHTSQLFTQ
ncbi:hypothetical protein ACPTJE_16345, partial [Enterococcus faecalis]|uniref:hypothetical protein n=1 Tax=Enterococcus faecalis TaxID=1351 RepID=UPI003CC5A3AE